MIVEDLVPFPNQFIAVIYKKPITIVFSSNIYCSHKLYILQEACLLTNIHDSWFQIPKVLEVFPQSETIKDTILYTDKNDSLYMYVLYSIISTIILLLLSSFCHSK